ncbi:MAG TPA: response regulator transcription factor [Pyrinomonadaceae bacterium]|jgi:DNA-binding NarL/FixJ family response regulator|nr:response regulator transcription factor [Pyrinomonadaceae bacterium]
MTEINVIIADDHPVFRQGLRQVIETDKQLHVVGEAVDGQEAIATILATTPDVAVLDVDMPNGDGFEVVRAIKSKQLPVRFLFLSMHKDERFLNAALDLGVKGYLLKDSAVTEIIASIKAVGAGRDYVSPALTSYLVNRSRRAAQLTDEKPAVGKLTPTERRILSRLGEYKTSKEIAGEMFISVRTVERHRANICEKLDLHGSHALIKFAAEHRSELSQ